MTITGADQRRSSPDFDKYLQVRRAECQHLWIYTMPLLLLTDRRGGVIVRTDAPRRRAALKCREMVADQGYLTEEELCAPCLTPCSSRNRPASWTMFLFGCFTELSYIDIKTLTHDKIQRMDFDNGENGCRAPDIVYPEQRPPHGDCQGADQRVQGACRGTILIFPMPSNGVTAPPQTAELASLRHPQEVASTHRRATPIADVVYLCNGSTIESRSPRYSGTSTFHGQIYAEVTNRMVAPFPGDFPATSPPSCSGACEEEGQEAGPEAGAPLHSGKWRNDATFPEGAGSRQRQELPGCG